MRRRKSHWSVYVMIGAYAASIVYWAAAPSPGRLWVALAALVLLQLAVYVTRKAKNKEE